MIRLENIRRSKTARVVAMFLALETAAQLVNPVQVFALTTGPSQPEMLSFEPISTSEMVNVFSGDFTYNIPLMDVGGYPINLSYNSGISTDQEASWVGLGWNINPGAITRSMRGVPDDFSGDQVTKRFNMKPNRTYSASTTLGGEAFGFSGGNLTYGVSMSYNNYSGVGYQQTLNMTFTSGEGGKGPLTGGLGVTSGTGGLDLTASVSYSGKIKTKEDSDVKGTGKLGLSMNSRSGLKALSLSASVTENASTIEKIENEDGTTSLQYHGATLSTNGGSSISFASPAYTPQVTMPMVNTSFSLSFKPGADFFGGDVTMDLAGSYSEQRLERTSQTLPAYGYLNSQAGANDEYAMHDFNREKDGAFTEHTPSLPLTNYTFDVYSVNGQGIGGSYRPFRSDLGYVYDSRNTTTNFSGNLGIELASGNIVHGGTDINITDVNTTSGRWVNDNSADDALKFKGQADISSATYKPLYEPFYFKEAGEKSVDSDPSLFNGIGGEDPIRVELDHTTGLTVVATGNYRIGGAAGVALPTLNYRAARQRRNQAITLLTVAEARKYGLQRSFYSSGISPSAKDHHVGEITTLRSDGTRYVFGIPAYNLTQQEATFNVQGRTTCPSKGSVAYSAGDNSIANSLGIDNYFSETELPAYAHSFLLTAVLSSDYVDYDGIEGPSAGDLGSYTKFNYVKAAPLFKWRTPIDGNARPANYNEGLKSDPADDKGSYVYGEKEVWYVSSIETKTYLAVFTLSDRNDGFGVNDKDGTLNTSVALKKIDKISLYSKPDYDANGSNATPIKVANFTYDYSLCPGIPNSNNSGGKLTLKKVYFTYAKSYKAKLSGYEFKYADINHDGTQDVNFNYNQKGSDRWGVYTSNPFANCTTTYSATSTIGPWEYPYTDQNRTTQGGHVASNATEYAAAWSLTDIELPSGGTISIDYEADDYAFVQDKRATQMFKVTDFKINHTGNTVDPSNITSINTGISAADLNLYVSGYPNYVGTDYYLFFKLQTNLATTTAGSDLVRDYLGDQTKNIYFRFLTDITNSGDYEYVSGYFDLDYVSSSNTGMGLVTTSSLLSGGLSQYGWMRIKKVPIGDRDNSISQDVNPIVKTAWQFGRLHLPRKVWGEPDPQGNGVEQVVTAIANSNMAQNVISFFKGPNRTIRDKGYGRKAIMNKSWIRMNNPDGYKYGGGSRVKKIAIKDNWKYMVTTNNSGTTTPNSALPTDYDASYGQEYTYTTVDPSNSSKTISSGVASYEPSLGGDENPFHEPVYFNEDRRLVPDDQSYIEKPYGESFFPSPGVGYSKVTVKSLANSSDNGNGLVTRHNTGYTVQEFYTAYDFPTITRVGWLEVQHWRTNPILSLLRIDMKDYLTASQGFVVELNDMHGKPKAVTVYEQGKTTPLSQVKYFYKTNAANTKQLDNTVLAIGKDGQATEQICGMDYDFVADMREQETRMVSAGARMNLAAFIAGILPAVVPTIIPSWSSEHTRFRSAGTTKVINRYGILVKTEATDAGGTATTENLAWDKETGEVLLTKTYTNFEDAVYNFSYPAHWAYDRMGQAYKNVGASFSGTMNTGGVVTFTGLTPNQYFVNGDEVAFETSSIWMRAWVCDATTTRITLMDINGATSTFPTSGSCSIKIIRSGRRNMQAISVGSVMTRTNPLKDINADQILDLYFENVLNAGSVEFAEQWSIAPGKTSATGCSCTLTTLGTQFANMLNTLAENKKLTVTATLLSNGVYSYGYTSALNDPRATPAPTSMTWNVSGTSTNVMIGTMTGGVGVTDCQTTLTLPSGYTWTQVIGLSNIQATEPDCQATTSTFTGTATLNTANGIVVVTFSGSTQCYTMGNCSSSTTCGVQAEQQINPYYHNVLGNWRMLRNHLYLSERSQDVAGPNNDNLDLRSNGVFVTRDQSTGNIINYQPFWSPNSGNDWTKNSTYWTWAQEVTRYTPFGNEVENKDALGRYSAAVFGYNHTLPIAIASNSRYQDIGFDGFEDYAFITQDCRELHFSFYGSGILDQGQAHTGVNSMKVNCTTSVSMTRNLATTTGTLSSASCNFTVAAGDLTGVFAPYTGGGARTFILNYWVKESTASGTPVFNYSNAAVEILVNSTPVTLTLIQKSGIIEGWQQYQYSFPLSASQSGTIEVKLKNNSSTYLAWFDDIRVMPAEANMVTYVYHPVNQRLTHQLDENNYATIYEYDEEGALVRIKKETERGIVTIKEARNNSFHR